MKTTDESATTPSNAKTENDAVRHFTHAITLAKSLQG